MLLLGRQRIAEAAWAISWLRTSRPSSALLARQPPAGATGLAPSPRNAACAALARCPARSVKDRFGPAPSIPLYAAFFLGTSINAAWLSVATCVQLLIALKMPLAGSSLEVPAVLAAAGLSCLGAWVLLREHDTGEAGGGWPAPGVEVGGRLPSPRG